jgi:hypothetical protein
MRFLQLPFLLMVTLFFSACNMAEIGGKTTDGKTAPPFTTTSTKVQPTPIQPVPTNTSVVLGDCFLVFHLGAWQDNDRNGLRGESEPPLEEVRFRLDGTYAELWGYPFLTKADGWVTLTTWSPGGCPAKDFSINAFPPESYEPTTPTSITVSLATGQSPFEARFGFYAAAH